MKELSIEEKAKAYDEAKLRMSAAYNSNRCTIGFMNEIFPELQGEDEKIRKVLISQYQGDGCIRTNEYRIDYKDIRAWLEKQGEQKSIDDLTQQEAMDIAVAKCFEQGEQKPTDKVEPKFKIGDHIKPIDKCLGSSRIIEEVYNGWYVTDKGTLYFEFEDNWELVEKNPVWSEEDEIIRQWIISDINKLYSLNKKSYFIVDKENKWLKFLKDRVQSQNTWKPSEGQLECLGYAIEKAKKDFSPLTNDRIYLTLKALKEQLEKL